MNCAKKHRQNLEAQWLKNFARIGFCTLVLFVTSKTIAQSTPAENNQDIAHVRLDAHPTADNSVLFTFDNGGPTMRLPKVLFDPNNIPKDPKQAIKAEVVGLTFWFPDMTSSDWSSTVEKALQRDRGTYVPEKDRFRVRILSMFYANPDWDDLSPEKRPLHGFHVRPLRADINRHCKPLGDANCVSEMQRFDSGFPGVDMQVAKDWLKNHPEFIEEERHHPERATYLAKPESPYELLMDCGAIECDADVYSKTYHLQYKMVFSSAAVSHTDELVKAIDRMIVRWSEK